MPRLKEVPKNKANAYINKYYDALFGDRDPAQEPGTATGTPGNWWTVFALVPYIFEHATKHFGMFGMFADKSVSQLDGVTRELGIMRAGYTQGSQFVFSQHCKAARRFGISDEKIAAIPYWEVSPIFDEKERAVLAWTDALILQGGRAPDELFEALHSCMPSVVRLCVWSMTMFLNAFARYQFQLLVRLLIGQVRLGQNESVLIRLLNLEINPTGRLNRYRLER